MKLRDRNFLSFDSRLTRCSGAFSGPKAGSYAECHPLNRRGPAASRVCPGTAHLEPRSLVPPLPPRAHPPQAAAAEMGLMERQKRFSE